MRGFVEGWGFRGKIELIIDLGVAVCDGFKDLEGFLIFIVWVTLKKLEFLYF